MAPKLKKHEKYGKVAPQRLKRKAKMDQEVSKRSPRVAKRSRREPKRANLETRKRKSPRNGLTGGRGGGCEAVLSNSGSGFEHACTWL